MDTCACALELLGMLVYVGAWLCALATTILPQWLTMSTALLPVESYELGLWETCVVQDVGGMECRAYDSLLGLSSDLKLARILMCTALAVGMLGILVAIPGLHLINSCKEQGGNRAKRTLTIIGGVLGMVSGVLCLIPVSYMAHLAVIHFFDDKVPDVVPRWEFGDALFCGWAAGFLLIVAGLLMVTSCSCSQVEPQPVLQRRYQVMGTDDRKRTEELCSSEEGLLFCSSSPPPERCSRPLGHSERLRSFPGNNHHSEAASSPHSHACSCQPPTRVT